MPRFMQRIAD